jgi:hypothetical protein
MAIALILIKKPTIPQFYRQHLGPQVETYGILSDQSKTIMVASSNSSNNNNTAATFALSQNCLKGNGLLQVII